MRIARTPDHDEPLDALGEALMNNAVREMLSAADPEATFPAPSVLNVCVEDETAHFHALAASYVADAGLITSCVIALDQTFIIHGSLFSPGVSTCVRTDQVMFGMGCFSLLLTTQKDMLLAQGNSGILDESHHISLLETIIPTALHQLMTRNN